MRASTARRVAVAWRYDVPLVVGLVVLWALLWGSWTPLTLLCGLVVALLTTQLLPLPPVPLSARLSPVGVVRFLVVWIGLVVAASFRVAWIAVRPRPVRRNSIVLVQLRATGEMTFTLATLAIALVPGSYVVDVDLRRRRLLLHVLDTERPDQVERERAEANRLEAMVIRALGSKQDVAALDDAVDGVVRTDSVRVPRRPRDRGAR
jgi:multicomponent Na+:H+ antiporter subunit E